MKVTQSHLLPVVWILVVIQTSLVPPCFAAAKSGPSAVAETKPQPTLLSALVMDFPKGTTQSSGGVFEALRFRLLTEWGYEPSTEDEINSLPTPPQQVTKIHTLRRSAKNETLFLRFGLVKISGLPHQIWLQSLISNQKTLSVDLTEAERVRELATSILNIREEAKKDISVSGLKPGLIHLSYIDADSAIQILAAMGYSVLNTPMGSSNIDDWNDTSTWNTTSDYGNYGDYGSYGSGSGTVTVGGYGNSNTGYAYNANNSYASSANVPPGMGLGLLPTLNKIEWDQLPVVIRMPSPDPQFSGLVGEQASVTRDQLGLTMIPGAASRLVPDTISSPTSQLLILYAEDEQFSRIRRVVETIIDRPARQIFVEGMVLEISQDGMDQLGVQWLSQNNNSDLLLGKLTPGGTVPGIDLVFDTGLNLASRFAVTIQALVQQGKAEILSRPSVLTLDNRQATIRVGTDIPIATSKDASSAAEARVSFSFQYLPTGILLNVRPRIESEGREVSMLIDTTVSSTVPGRDLELRSPISNAVLASAPTINTRRVQTYARIGNNTPLIIGGLISRDTTQNNDNIPLLSDIPLLGKIFTAEASSSSKREVIIVLTPSVMSDEQSIARTLPQDKDEFDSFGYRLFRDTYRLRAHDVFDTRFIRSNYHLSTYQKHLKELAARDVNIDNHPLLSDLHAGRVPGEEILVSGMIFEIMNRLDFGQRNYPTSSMIFYEGTPDKTAMTSLDKVLAQYGDGVRPESFFERNPGKALALTFTNQRSQSAGGHVFAEPTPRIQLVDCPDRSAWERMLWEMNEPKSGREEYTVLLHRPEDLERLSDAISLKRLLSVNGGERNARISNFLVGRVISIPDIRPEHKSLLESAVARYFFHSVHYARSFASEFSSKLRQIDAILRSPDFQNLVDPDLLPAPPSASATTIPKTPRTLDASLGH